MNKPLFSEDLAAATAITLPKAPWIERGNNARWLVGALWLECIIVWMFWYWGSFANLDFRDPDDAMRLVQVRDFIAGQSWFDVSQHRVSPPTGGPMHWSRLLDLPIAGIIVTLRPLLGQALAEIIACITVPIMTLGIICFGMFAAMKEFLGTHRALLTVALLATSFPILIQLAPLRIDHHGWQIATAVGMLGGIIAPDAKRGGWLAGLATAFWLHISGEGLPFAVIAGAVLALRYAVQASEWDRLIRYVATLSVGSAILLFTTHGWEASLAPHCDSMSPPYLVPLMLLFPALLLGKRIVGDATMLHRLSPVAVAGLGAAALFVASSPQCLAGPFQTLDPIVYKYWYLGVMEGQPFWRQDASTAAIIIVPSLVGLLGLLAATVHEKDPSRRLQWGSILLLALGSFLISLMVLRAMSTAHLFALIGNGWIIARIYPRIAALSTMPARVIATVSLCVLAPAGLALSASSAATAMTGKTPPPATEKPRCYDAAQIGSLSRLPNTTIFAPIDLGPAILQRTGHSVIATAHHRNVAGIGTVMRASIAKPDEARRIITATSARYYLTCPGLNEIKRYDRIAPDGLAAQVRAGHVPSWLQPVPVQGLSDMQLYRIIR